MYCEFSSESAHCWQLVFCGAVNDGVELLRCAILDDKRNMEGTQGIEQILEKLACLEKLVNLLVVKTQEIASYSRQVVADAERAQKVEVSPIEIKLGGFSWQITFMYVNPSL